jgi:hypothetical protein
MPANIPNSLLDSLINSKLKEKLKKSGIDYKDSDTLSVLLRKIINKDTQPFYSYDRVYKNEDKELITIKQLIGLQSKTIKAKYGNFTEANEKLIRFYQTKDRILKLMCDLLIREDENIVNEERFLLKNIYPTSEISILNNPARFKHLLKKEGKSRDLFFTVVAEDTEKQIAEIENWKKLDTDQRKKWTDLKTKEQQQAFLENCTDEEKKIYHGQKGYQWKFKDYGRFRRFLKDKRLDGLSSYFETKEIPFDFLEYQIMEYDRIREKIFELIFKLEKAIFDKDPKGLINLELKERPKDFNQVKFDIYIVWLENNNISFSKDLIKWGRNTFLHSQFPDLKDFGNIEKITDDQIDNFNYYKKALGGKAKINISIAQKIITKFEDEITQIIKRL